MTFEINSSKSINDTLAKMNAGDVLILADGIYREKIDVMVDDISIQAKHTGKAILSNKDYYHKIMKDNNECNTFRTYTLYIESNHVYLEGLIIQNEAIPSNIYGQAVALHVDGNDFHCVNCIISSAQDTLFTGPLPKDLCERYASFYPKERLKGLPSKQVYKNCAIKGDVDFIFGCATALFDHCEIITLNRDSKTPSYICAPAHPKELPFGYLFYKCKFMGEEFAYLARPWRDFGCAAFIECEMGSHILPEGFNKWNDTSRDKTARFFEYTIGLDIKQRVPWSKQFTSQEAQNYLTKFQEYLSLKAE